MNGISHEGWSIAQDLERQFWEEKIKNPARLIETIYDKYSLLREIKSIFPKIVEEPQNNKNKALEMGIGPLGLGMVSLLEPAEKWEITGVEPLPKLTVTGLPKFLTAFFNELFNRPLTYIQKPAEEVDSPLNTFNLAICDNVLEHTYSPEKIIMNIYNMLTAGGYLVIRENAVSLFSKWRKIIWKEKYHDEQHPFTFTYRDLIDMVTKNHFRLIYTQRDSHETFKRICYKSRKMIIICQK